jgi:hypothetical protein
MYSDDDNMNVDILDPDLELELEKFDEDGNPIGLDDLEDLEDSDDFL